ncbi:hypothetical protein C8J57DRAFT_1632523 [Mycena rebaudengoi]|nr:hypothetical protein C8J57DRAFT_1632523 [Mycena rebaudengoi]
MVEAALLILGVASLCAHAIHLCLGPPARRPRRTRDVLGHPPCPRASPTYHDPVYLSPVDVVYAPVHVGALAASIHWEQSADAAIHGGVGLRYAAERVSARRVREAMAGSAGRAERTRAVSVLNGTAFGVCLELSAYRIYDAPSSLTPLTFAAVY